jgi:N-acetylglucosamine kinase-like BadF-type ATPase
MSGGTADKESLLREVVTADQWLVTHDGLIALSGALAGGDGIVAIAGTGQIAFGRKGGRTMRAGGWGYIFGDEGGAFWIVREAVRAALRFEEGWGWPTELHGMLLAATGTKSANEVLHAFYTPEWPRARVAGLAAEVARAAEAGDEMATTILQIAGAKLAQFVFSIRNSLWGADEVAPASYIGGVFQNSDVFSSFRDILENGGKVRVQAPVWSADAGALIEAYRVAGVHSGLREE